MPRFMREIRHIHFVGIGGVGMSGIAQVLINLGYAVSGSDVGSSSITEILQAAGARVALGHDASHLGESDVVVISSAIAADNPEVLAAQALRIPVISRAEMLAELMRFRYGIAVAGTHGKTTTTSLVTSILAEGGLDPTYVIGGILNSAGQQAQLGKGQYFVAEADESDASFLYLKPMAAVVTNIDQDHMSTYGGDFAKVKQTFIDFLHHLPFYGQAIICLDDPVIAEILPKIHRPICTYGFNLQADVCATEYRTIGLTSQFVVHFADGQPSFPVQLNLPGKHNVLNALAAIAIGKEVGVDDKAIQRALSQFAGIGRRMQVKPHVSLGPHTVTIVDDYGHHPQEVSVTIEALREVWPNRRLVMVFQPHRYTRTRDLLDDFARTLSTVDKLLLMEVYSAGEPPIQGADGRSLARAIRERGQCEPVFVAEKSDVPAVLARMTMPDDVVVFQGAGNVGQLVLEVIATSETISE